MQESGLSSSEAALRLASYGRNALPTGKQDSAFKIFVRQFRSPLIYLLAAASLALFFLGEAIDASIILFVLFFNSLVGALQEGKAQNTLLALKKMVQTEATVIRDGRELVISDEEVVPGDLLLLDEGQKIAADARVIFSNHLRVAEAALTGESEPIDKISGEGERSMIFKGTHVVGGNGRAVIVATGANTKIGKISSKILTIDSEIPLQENIRSLSRALVVIVVTICAVFFVAGILLGISLRDMFGTVVALAVSIIPEGLPIVMTLVLATGVWRMSKRHALVKRLQAVESLGQARVILVDKTGTITKNEMVAQRMYAGGEVFEIGGVGYEPRGDVMVNGRTIAPADISARADFLQLARMMLIGVHARVALVQETQLWTAFGDPTDAALFVLGEKLVSYIGKNTIRTLAELPFDYKSAYRAVVCEIDGRRVLIVIGAPEVVLRLCNFSSETVENSINVKSAAESAFHDFSSHGLRVLGFAIRPYHSDAVGRVEVEEGGFRFVGCVGIKDALRPEVPQALARAHEAGVRVVMITGDHEKTARAIATEAGIYKSERGDIVMSGAELDRLSDEALAAQLSPVFVFARVTPDHKLRIVKAYQSRGEVVAMTGDGVNDALSLVAADLGVAMGKIGTEVAKEAADIVLLDDNFGSIVSAIEEGRNIDNAINKVILYLFSTSLGETLVIGGALLGGLPLPLLPIQIIWLNFVTDSFLDVALAMEPKEDNLLRGNFERPTKYLVDKLMIIRMACMAVPMMIGALLLFWLNFESDLTKAWTIALTTLAVFQWLNAWNCRHEVKSIFQMHPFSNMYLVAATGVVISLQLLVVYHPLMQKWFHTSSLTLQEWIIILVVSCSIVVVEEIRKFLWSRAR